MAGHVYRLKVPDDTFHDLEDGDSMRLLFKDVDGMPVGRNSWIQFDPQRKEIYAL